MNTQIKTAEEKMGKTINAYKNELSTIRAGRANPAVLDKITVDYYGSATPINQVASVAVSEARVLVISPWDATQIKAIEKAILTSDLGINPTNDGKVIRIAFPPLTEERRRDLVKGVKKTAEDSKVAIRSIRRDSIDKLKNMKKEGEITEDDLKIGEKKMQNLTDDFCAKIDAMTKEKESEIMEI